MPIPRARPSLMNAPTTPKLSTIRLARVVRRSKSSLARSAEICSSLPRRRTNPSRSPPCGSSRTTSNDSMLPACGGWPYPWIDSLNTSRLLRSRPRTGGPQPRNNPASAIPTLLSPPCLSDRASQGGGRAVNAAGSSRCSPTQLDVDGDPALPDIDEAEVEREAAPHLVQQGHRPGELHLDQRAVALEAPHVHVLGLGETGERLLEVTERGDVGEWAGVDDDLSLEQALAGGGRRRRGAGGGGLERPGLLLKRRGGGGGASVPPPPTHRALVLGHERARPGPH